MQDRRPLLLIVLAVLTCVALADQYLVRMTFLEDLASGFSIVEGKDRVRIR